MTDMPYIYIYTYIHIYIYTDSEHVQWTMWGSLRCPVLLWVWLQFELLHVCDDPRNTTLMMPPSIWMNEWMNEWMNVWYPQSLGRENWLCLPSREGSDLVFGFWLDTWLSDSSANTASVANTWVNGLHNYVAVY